MSPGRRRLLPRFLFRGLERLIRQDELNAILEATYPHEGSDFAREIYRYLDTEIEVVGAERVPAEGRYVFASNHPLGGLDGIGLVKVLGERYGDENIRFPVNDMLLHVEPLRRVFLAVNKYGSQSREAARTMNEAYASERQIAIFPAGLVSRLHTDGSIRDLQWQKSFVSKAIEHQRQIVPVRFEGLNTMRFYRTAKWRKRLGLKINIEQALLPSELCKAKGKRYRVVFGEPINPAALKSEGRSINEITRMVRDISDSLAN